MVRGFLALGGLSVACSAAAQNVEIPRPRQYPPAFSQFMVSSWADCRTVSVMRLGAGPERPAEMTVFEVVESGGRLRRLHHVTLKNPYLPWNWIVTGAGRFMLTIDDRWVEGQIQQAHPATTGNCLVIYDLVRGSARALAAREFLTKPAGDSWCGPWIWVDPLMNQIFLVEPEECERSGKPFIVADRSANGRSPGKFESPDGAPCRSSEAPWVMRHRLGLVQRRWPRTIVGQGLTAACVSLAYTPADGARQG